MPLTGQLPLTDKDYKFKFFCAQVGILLAANWVDKVIEVQHISDRTIIRKLMIGKAVFTFPSMYTPCTYLVKDQRNKIILIKHLSELTQFR